MYNKLKEDYVFAIIGDETKGLIKQAEQVTQEKFKNFQTELAQDNIILTSNAEGKLSFELKDGITEPPLGWTYRDHRSGEIYLDSNPSIMAGRKIAFKIEAIYDSQSISKTFNELCCKKASVAAGLHYRLEHLGEDIILACPASHSGNSGKTAKVPSDCRIISFSEYMDLIEAHDPKPAITVVKFDCK
jgi:hypothetical protein